MRLCEEASILSWKDCLGIIAPAAEDLNKLYFSVRPNVEILPVFTKINNSRRIHPYTHSHVLSSLTLLPPHHIQQAGHVS